MRGRSCDAHLTDWQPHDPYSSCLASPDWLHQRATLGGHQLRDG